MQIFRVFRENTRCSYFIGENLQAFIRNGNHFFKVEGFVTLAGGFFTAAEAEEEVASLVVFEDAAVAGTSAFGATFFGADSRSNAVTFFFLASSFGAVAFVETEFSDD